ncbi:hypothetical protein Tco_1459960, partial [Tanacetum coccineum]
QLQSDRLRDEAQAEIEDFINKLDGNIRKIIKEQVKVQVKDQVSKILPRIEKIVDEQIEVEVLTCSSNKAKTSHVVAANLFKLEQKKILIDKICRDDKDEDKEPSARSNRGSKRRRVGKEPESTSAPKEKTSKSTSKSKEGSKTHQAEEPTHTVDDLKEPVHQKFDAMFSVDQPIDDTTQLPDWFQKPTKPPTLDRDWNKTLPAKHGPVQLWISTLA